MISVVIPCHNHGRYLRTAIDSVLVQSRGDHEILIVDDHSEDDTVEVSGSAIEENPGRAIKYLPLHASRGLSAARNFAIEHHAAGEYILPLDADDFLHPSYLAETVPLLDDNKADIVAADRINFGLHCAPVRPGKPNPDMFPLINQIGYCSVYRKSCWEKVGGYPINYPRMGYEDWEFWLRCAMAGFRFECVPKVLWHYRDRPKSMAKTALGDDEYLMARMITRLPQNYSMESIERAFKIVDREMKNDEKHEGDDCFS